MAKVKIDKERCKGCGLCIFFCPFGHLQFSQELNKRGNQYAEPKKGSECKGCKQCYLICPDYCIEIYQEDVSKKKWEESFNHR
ncbi:MAG TPA: 4Fe-4S dicluster domain-containing protein [Candidatus Omnitrophica bacterium]|nr:4Fe-4S dicluster domain-containing protein [Candidatus Omnitrophota bacterium]